MDALLAKFPKAKIDKCTKAKEGDDIVYDIEFKQEARKCEADITEKGIYINYEKAIERKDLPKAVIDAVEKRYPKSTLKEIMEETEVKGKEEKLSAYEVVLVTAKKKEVEVRSVPSGQDPRRHRRREAARQEVTLVRIHFTSRTALFALSPSASSH